MERGESMERVGDRVDGLVNALARSRRGTGVVLVAHGEVLAAYLGHIQGPSSPKRDPKALGNGSITVVDVAPTGAPTIRLENHVPATP
jgi:broad specificity phosphatase PhoE